MILRDGMVRKASEYSKQSDRISFYIAHSDYDEEIINMKIKNILTLRCTLILRDARTVGHLNMISRAWNKSACCLKTNI